MAAVHYEKCTSPHTSGFDRFEYTIRVLSVHCFPPDRNWNALIKLSIVSMGSMDIGIRLTVYLLVNWHLFSVKDVWSDASVTESVISTCCLNHQVSLCIWASRQRSSLSVVHILLKRWFFISEGSHGAAASRLVWQDCKLGGERDQLFTTAYFNCDLVGRFLFRTLLQQEED